MGAETKSNSANDNASDSVSLKSNIGLEQKLGLWGGVSLIVGTIIGSGIFISPQGVTEGAGSVGLSLIIWLVCGIISLLGALCYAELGTFIKASGGDYSYMLYCYGDCLAFLMSWCYVLLVQPAGQAIISLTCASYILTPFFDDGCGSPPNDIEKILAISVVLILAVINCLSVELAAQIQIIFTVAKIIALVFIIGGGFYWIIIGNEGYLKTGFDGTNDDAGEIVMAFYSCMWSYIGWANLNYVTEEVTQPEKTLPRAIWIGVPLVIVVYLLTNISYYAVLSPEEMISSSAVAISWAEYVIPNNKWLIPVSVALSTFGSCNGGLFVTGRIAYAAARNGHMMDILSMVHIHRLTPFPAVAFTSILMVLYAVPGDIGALIDLFNFVIWIIYAMVTLEVIILRWTKPDVERPYKVMLWIPITVFICAVLLVVLPLITDPRMEYLFAIIFILVGFIFYVPIVWKEHYMPGMNTITKFFQLLLEVSPPPEFNEEMVLELDGLEQDIAQRYVT